MTWVSRCDCPAHCNRLVVSFERKQCHVPRDGRTDGQKRIERTDLPRPLQRLEAALWLTAACERIGESCIPERKIWIYIHGQRKMPHRIIGAALARMTEPEHEVSPGVLLIQRQRGCAGLEGSFRQFTDRHMRIQIEHVRVGRTQQRMDMRTPLRRCAGSSLLQQLLCEQLLAYAHAPQMWKGLRHQLVRGRVI